MTIQDVTYLQRRMTASYEAAERAAHPAVRKVHLTLAKLYHDQLQAVRAEDGASYVMPSISRPVLNPRWASATALPTQEHSAG